MEVHAHAHTERKKWSHYLWEFIMLFLAVFCGFLAENLREHKVEQERAEQLAKNLYADVLSDSANIQQFTDTRLTKERKCEYFIRYVRDSSLTEVSSAFYPAFGWATIMTRQVIFEPNDGIISQLRNSGELRYFKNQDLQAIISRLSVDIANIRARNDKEYSFIELNLRPFTLRHFDFGWYEKITHNGTLTFQQGLNEVESKPIPATIKNLEKFDRLEAENLVSYYLLMLRGTRQTQYIAYVQDNHKLLELLRETFKISIQYWRI